MIRVFKKIFNFIFIGLFIFIILINFRIDVNAIINSISLDITSAELYSATNTYNYNPNVTYNNSSLIPGEENNRLYIMNSISDKNLNGMSADAPLLTVLTHGLGGCAEQWSNNGNDQLGYTQNSILASLFDLGNSNVYIAAVKNNVYSLYNITEPIAAKSNYINYLNYKVDSITDISKHSIILFNCDDETTNEENYKVYREFNYAISRVVYDIKMLNNNKLPKMNLIGHSRGGITNIEYALDHPDLVESIYSLGTPYCGSSTASIDVALGCPIGGCPEGELDIITQSKYMNYLNRWNNNYEELGYDDIDVYALGGYATLLFYQTMVWTPQGQKGLDYLLQGTIPAELAAGIVDAVFLGIEYAVLKSFYLFMNSGVEQRKILIGTAVSEALANFDLSQACIDDIIQIIVSELNLDYHFPFVSWYNDGFVDLSSQLGYYGGTMIYTNGYRGFNRESFCFTSTNSNTDAFALDQLPIVHNLEIRDRRMINYIMKRINFSGKVLIDYETYYISDNEIGIKSYIGETSTETLIIPEYINGKKVVEIGKFAFANNFNGEYTIQSIIVPKTITKIDDSAFENCTNLEQVSFADNSNLKNIEKNSFYGCTGLSEIEVPDSVEKVDDYAFAYCTNLTGTFVLPTNLITFGENVFLSTGISNISIDSTNLNFTVSDSTLYNKTQTIIYLSYASGAYIVPNSVSTINNYAFCNNKNILSVNLNNVIEIGNYAFLNCENLNTISGGNNLSKANIKDFSATEWEQNNDYIIIGSVLLKYNSENITYEVPKNIKYIGEYAFESNSLSTVYINSNVETIANYAFINCPSLINIYILNNNQPIIYRL